jgi:Asparagine synthase (glutamine-hydrolyzing)
MIVKGKRISVKKYWELSFSKTGEYVTSLEDEAADKFYSLLKDSVSLRMRSDVPVAAYLSGGLDSSAITYCIKQISPQNLQTFSIGFSDKDYDETHFQQQVSRHLHTTHQSFKCTSSDIADVFPEVIWYSESPLFRTAAAPMFLLSRKVRENNIKVVMTGEGADEILAGYDIFKEAQIRYFWSKYPDSKYRPLLLKKLYPYVSQMNNLSPQVLKFIFGLKLADTKNPFYAFLLRWNNGSLIRNYFSQTVKHQLLAYNPVDEVEKILPSGYETWDELSRAQWVETKLLMSNYLLSSQGDRMGMANSIEGRYPFLDYRLIEYASQLPPTFKMRGLNEKYLLKKVMTQKLPDSVVKRSKQAYRAPISSVFLSNDQPEYVKYYLSEAKIKEYDVFDFHMVSRLVQKIKERKNISENDTIALTAIISTQLFYAMYIDRSFKPVSGLNLLKSRVVNKLSV